MKTVYYILFSLNILVILLSLKKVGKMFLPIFLLIPVALFTEIFAENFDNIKFVANHIYHIAEMLLLSGYYYLQYQNKKTKRLVLVGFIVYSILLFMHYSLHPRAFFVSNFYDFVLNSILIILFVILYFFEELNNEIITPFYKEPSFYINVGNLFFYAGTMLVMGFKYLVEKTNPALGESLMLINHSLNLLLYALYLLAFICILQTQKPQH